jgi:hypothetical protein
MESINGLCKYTEILSRPLFRKSSSIQKPRRSLLSSLFHPIIVSFYLSIVLSYIFFL